MVNVTYDACNPTFVTNDQSDTNLLLSFSQWKSYFNGCRGQRIHLQYRRHFLDVGHISTHLDHDPGVWFLLLRLLAAEKCAVYAVLERGDVYGCIAAVVLLGILPGL